MEPQEEKKGVRALIDARAETSTSIITHLTVRVCALGGIGGQGGGMTPLFAAHRTLTTTCNAKPIVPRE